MDVFYKFKPVDIWNLFTSLHVFLHLKNIILSNCRIMLQMQQFATTHMSDSFLYCFRDGYDLLMLKF